MEWMQYAEIHSIYIKKKKKKKKIVQMQIHHMILKGSIFQIFPL